MEEGGSHGGTDVADDSRNLIEVHAALRAWSGREDCFARVKYLKLTSSKIQTTGKVTSRGQVAKGKEKWKKCHSPESKWWIEEGAHWPGNVEFYQFRATLGTFHTLQLSQSTTATSKV